MEQYGTKTEQNWEQLDGMGVLCIPLGEQNVAIFSTVSAACMDDSYHDVVSEVDDDVDDVSDKENETEEKGNDSNSRAETAGIAVVVPAVSIELHLVRYASKHYDGAQLQGEGGTN